MLDAAGRRKNQIETVFESRVFTNSSAWTPCVVVAIPQYSLKLVIFPRKISSADDRNDIDDFSASDSDDDDFGGLDPPQQNRTNLTPSNSMNEDRLTENLTNLVDNEDHSTSFRQSDEGNQLLSMDEVTENQGANDRSDTHEEPNNEDDGVSTLCDLEHAILRKNQAEDAARNRDRQEDPSGGPGISAPTLEIQAGSCDNPGQNPDQSDELTSGSDAPARDEENFDPSFGEHSGIDGTEVTLNQSSNGEIDLSRIRQCWSTADAEVIQEGIPDTKRRTRNGQMICCLFAILIAGSVTFLMLFLPRYSQESDSDMISSYSPSQSPTRESVADLINVFSPYSSIEALTSRNSPQNKAVEYISDFLGSGSFAEADFTEQSLIVQRYVMAVVYFALGGEDWLACGSERPSCGAFGSSAAWLVGDDLCSWHMVQCNDRQQVVSLRTKDALPRVRMQGRVPSEIQFLYGINVLEFSSDNLEGEVLPFTRNMENLTELVLSGNQFEGEIDGFLSMDHPKLTVLKLDNNDFEGTVPHSVSKLSALEVFHLTHNRNYGTLPSSLYELSSLKSFEVGDNDFAGTISSNIGSLSFLTSLSLASTLMNGVIPSELFLLSSLELLKLNGAKFSGPLETEGFLQLTGLRVLHLQDSAFVGEIPVPAFEQYLAIRELRLDGNPALSGSISEAICAKRHSLRLYDLRVGCDNVYCRPGCCTDRCIRKK